MDWLRLDKAQTLGMIESVRMDGTGSLFSPSSSEAKSVPLPFYRTRRLYQLCNYASLPVFAMTYLGDGLTYSYLDGTADPIFRANEGGDLVLNEMSIIPYLAFYFRHVVLDEGEIGLLSDPDDLTYFDEPDFEPDYSKLVTAPGAIIQQHPETLAWHIQTPLYWGGNMVRANIIVSALGHVDLVSGGMMMNTKSTEIKHDESSYSSYVPPK